MYIVFSILALLCFGFMIYFDHLLLTKASLRFVLLIKSILFMGFALIFVATKESFNKLIDFVDLEWLFLAIFAVSSLVIIFFYNLSIKEDKPSTFALNVVSSLILFTNIFFLIFSIKSITHGLKPINLTLVIVEMVLALGVLLLNILLNKDNKKLNIIFIGVTTLAVAGLEILRAVKIKDKVLVRQPLEVFVFWMAVVTLVAAILFFIFTRKKNLTNKEKRENRVSWQTYVLAVIPAALGIVSFALAYGANNNYKDANLTVIKMIVLLAFLVPVILEIISEFRKGLKFKMVIKNNGVLLLNSVALSISLALYTTAYLL